MVVCVRRRDACVVSALCTLQPQQYNHASNYKSKQHRKTHGACLNLNASGLKMFRIIEAEERLKADPTAEGMVAPTLTPAVSRAVAKRRKRRKVTAPRSGRDSSSSSPSEEGSDGAEDGMESMASS